MRMNDGSSTGEARLPHDVVVVVVTYGDRAARCIEAVDSALADGVGRAIIVDNGSYAGAARALVVYAASDERVSLHRSETNEGSAGGFASAIKMGAAGDHPYVLLLDDDNILESGSVAAAMGLFPHGEEASPFAVAIPRLADPNHSAVLAGTPVDEVYAQGGEFFEFDVRRRVRRAAPVRSATAVSAPVQIPRTPYGGLLLRSRDLSIVGTPRADFVLYCDDYEFTERYQTAGGAVVLSPVGGIVDRGLRWGEEAGVSNLARIAAAGSDWRAYYLFRNCAIVERDRARRTRTRGWFAVNGLIYSLYVIVTSARLRSASLLSAYSSAQLDALIGRTGRRRELPSSK